MSVLFLSPTLRFSIFRPSGLLHGQHGAILGDCLLAVPRVDCYQSRWLCVSGPSWNVMWGGIQTVAHEQLTIYDLFSYTAIIHTMYLIQQSKTRLANEKMHSPGVCLLQKNNVSYSPCDASWAAEMETLSGVLLAWYTLSMILSRNAEY